VVTATSLALAAPARAEDHAEPGPQLAIGLRMENGNHRSFRHEEATTGEVRTYDARVYGGLGVELAYEQPFAGTPFSLSLSADYFHSLLFTSGARRLERTVDTTAQRGDVVIGFSARPSATPDSTSIGLHAGLGAMGFDFAMPGPESEDDRTMQLATGNYTLARAGAGARIPVSAFAFALRGSYLMGLRTGEFGGRVPLEQPHGLDALAVVEYRLLDWLHLTLRGGLTLLWLRLAPLQARPDDDPAGVRDRYLSLGLGARARL
jgi:hypothetical protein